MPTKTIAPGLTLTDELFAAAATGLAEHMPELPALTWERFTSNEWTLVPDEQTGEAYKAEWTILKTRTRTARMNLWFAPDLRDGAAPKPHNHPWDFASAILTGTYVEQRWTRRGDVVIPTADVEHGAGEMNKIGRETFHEVTEVEPGATLTLMGCGPGMASWGYLDPDTGAYTESSLPDGFMAQLRALNPHQH